MTALPIRRAQFKVGEFAAWLKKQGAEIADPTNPYEVIRYRAYNSTSQRSGTHVVYAKDNGLLTFAGVTRRHYEAFLSGENVPGMFVSQFDGNPPDGWQRPNGEPFSKKGKSVGAIKREKLLVRDGDECWFCGLALGDDQTIEHLIPRSEGGRDSMMNYVLAHQPCNARAANMPLVKKIELRAAMRAEAAKQEEAEL